VQNVGALGVQPRVMRHYCYHGTVLCWRNLWIWTAETCVHSQH